MSTPSLEVSFFLGFQSPPFFFLLFLARSDPFSRLRSVSINLSQSSGWGEFATPFVIPGHEIVGKVTKVGKK